MCLAFEVWKGWSKRMNLEELNEDCSQKQKKGIHFIIASIVIWLLLWFSEDICCLIAGYIIQFISDIVNNYSNIIFNSWLKFCKLFSCNNDDSARNNI